MVSRSWQEWKIAEVTFTRLRPNDASSIQALSLLPNTRIRNCLPDWNESQYKIGRFDFRTRKGKMKNITRRQAAKRLSALAGATIATPMINFGWFELFAQTTTKYSGRAI